MPFPPDRPISTLEHFIPPFPLPPLNTTCVSGFDYETIDIRWTYPSNIPANTKWTILGVNVYRSFNSEFGPYHRLNSIPISTTFYRDRTSVRVSLREDVSGSFSHFGPPDTENRYIFKTLHKPIIIDNIDGTPDAIDLNVFVTVDGVQSNVYSIDSNRGLVELRNYATYDAVNQTKVDPILPVPGSTVLATYRYVDNKVKRSLNQRIFYKITTVVDDPEYGLQETPLDRAATVNVHEVEKLDYMWREAVRRNHFLLVQGGERVKVFIRKTAGTICGCYSYEHRQPSFDCSVCYATGIIGGYEGPYDIIIAPDEGDISIAQGEKGRKKVHIYDSWTGPSPLLSKRDFFVKQNGDRYAIGSVKMPSNRGMQLQQFFPVSFLNEDDIRYSVRIPDPVFSVYPATRYIENGHAISSPMMTDAPNLPDEREYRGQTVAYENTNRRLFCLTSLHR